MPTATKPPVLKKTVAKKTASPQNKEPDSLLGTKAPTFTLPTNGGGQVSSKALKGKPYVLYFYPKDNTSGCATEACGFRDALPAFSALDATIIGVSKDSVKSHDKFAAHYDLTFPLASDEDGTVLQAFGVWIEKSMYGRKYMGIDRSTFLVDANGTIRAVWRKVSVTGHVESVQMALAAL